ncbi:MAG: UDP-N-acetylmuramoyl-L-alanyl-D-glutamate--2,6-diaminopimelate ligase [Calditrichaceae bacterium]
MKQNTIGAILGGIAANIPENVQSKIVTNLQYDSRKVEAGSLFFAVKGFIVDGHKYLGAVKDAGAVAAVVQDVHPEVDLSQIEVIDSRKAMALISRNFYTPEIDDLSLVGITGTNGKTTTSFLVQSILEKTGIKTGLIGTIAYYIGPQKINAWNTTPESVDLYNLLSQIYLNQQKAAVLEVSSHALALHRVDGMQFDEAVFTNLSRDHMDFHENEEEYFRTKAKLFSMLKPGGKAIINIDDLYGKRLSEEFNLKTITYGFDADAQVRIENWQMNMTGMHLNINSPAGKLEINTKLIGEFNIHNILSAVGVGIARELQLASIKLGIEAVDHIPGRLQSFEIKEGVVAVIDYAHTPDSLDKAIRTLHKVVQNRLIVVFGCGGDRDKGKRPQMGRIAETLGDIAIVTTDNPRTEKPENIIEDILAGMSLNEKQIVISDRREAIRKAIEIAEKGDIILVAGKGHEQYQEINGVKYDFNEYAIIKDAASHA